MSQLGGSDEGIMQAVRELQAEAYVTLETLVAQLKALTDQIRGFSPADRQPLLLQQKTSGNAH